METGLSSGPCPSNLCYFCGTKQLGNWIIHLQTGSQKHMAPSTALQGHILEVPPQSITDYWSASGSFSFMPWAGTQWHQSQCKGWTFTSVGILS